jgi:hypothetical protein
MVIRNGGRSSWITLNILIISLEPTINWSYLPFSKAYVSTSTSETDSFLPTVYESIFNSLSSCIAIRSEGAIPQNGSRSSNILSYSSGSCTLCSVTYFHLKMLVGQARHINERWFLTHQRSNPFGGNLL